ncbi:MAG: hypothetical protein ACM3PU_12210, partial [Gemmatimonadota bacterium]
MRWFVVIPGSLVPAPLASDILGAAQAGQLAAWLVRAGRAPDEAVRDAPINATHLTWLWRAFCGGSTVPVTAPYAWRALNHASAVLPDDGSQWWHCDPIHVEVARDHLLVGRSQDALLTEAEADALATEADAVLREHDALLKRMRHDAWFVQIGTPWQLDTAPLITARGQSMGPCLPRGADAARWRRILTEIQMRWHRHAVNLAREQRGQAPVNGVWLHGGGAWAPLPRSPFVAIASDDAVLRGWGLAAGLPPTALIGEADVPPRHGDVVSLWPELLEPAAFESWAVWLERLAAVQARLDRLRQHAFASGIESIELVLTGRQATRVFSLGRRDHLRFWRGVARR